MACTTTEKNAPAFEYLGVRHERSSLAMAVIAFFAIFRRDLLVTWRDLMAFLIEIVLQPLFLLFIFGKVLPNIGFASHGFGAVLLPGIVGLTVILTALQGVTLPLVIDLGYAHEIDDRLLAPMPVRLVAIEKILFAALRGLIAGTIIFPLAYWILGSDYMVRADTLGTLIGILILTAFAGACLGLTIGTLVQPEKFGLVFSLILTPMIFLGCTYYPWETLGVIKWFQMITLLNPLTYASEGLRYAMVPTAAHVSTLDIGWVLLGLSATVVIFLTIGINTFYHRVVR